MFNFVHCTNIFGYTVVQHKCLQFIFHVSFSFTLTPSYLYLQALLIPLPLTFIVKESVLKCLFVIKIYLF